MNNKIQPRTMVASSQICGDKILETRFFERISIISIKHMCYELMISNNHQLVKTTILITMYLLCHSGDIMEKSIYLYIQIDFTS